MFAVQVLQQGGKRSSRRWQTVATAHRYSVAERLLQGWRVDRKRVLEVSRIIPFSGPITKAYHLAGGEASANVTR